MDAGTVQDFNWSMARCNECSGVIAKNDTECYVCGTPVPGAKKFQRRKKQVKASAPITPFSNVLFIASLLLTLISFFTHKMSLSTTATLSGGLFVARIFSDRLAAKNTQN